MSVAPARGRGLKLTSYKDAFHVASRPRKGAWIEISRLSAASLGVTSPPQGGVD